MSWCTKLNRVHTFLWYRWYPLKCKPGQNKTDYRGDLEVRVSFTVKAVQNQDHGGSTASIANKNKHKGKIDTNNSFQSLFDFHDLDKLNDNCFSIVFRLVTIVEQGSCKSWWISLKHRIQGNVKQHKMTSVIRGLIMLDIQYIIF